MSVTAWSGHPESPDCVVQPRTIKFNLPGLTGATEPLPPPTRVGGGNNRSIGGTQGELSSLEMDNFVNL